MKVSELKGAELDCWTAKAQGITPSPLYYPSRNWKQCGPLIEGYKLALVPVMDGTWYVEWDVSTGGDDYETYTEHGVTPQEAICRAVIASVYGEEVPDE